MKKIVCFLVVWSVFFVSTAYAETVYVLEFSEKSSLKIKTLA